MSVPFVSWVPTVTGHLSFSTVGLSRTPEKVHQAYLEVGSSKYIVACQERPTGDAPFRFYERRLHRESTLYFIFLGQCREEEGFDCLSGPCFILNSEVYRLVCSSLRALCSSTETFPDALDSAIGAIEFHSEHPGFLRSGVKLWRDGRIRIDVGDLPSNYDRDFYDSLASQVYFFVRDLAHKHQHHSDTSDTILDVVPGSEFSAEWKRQTLYALFRWIIHRKRERNIINYLRAKGVLAYAQAFKSMHIKAPDLEAPDAVPNYLDDPLLKSLDAAQGALKNIEDGTSRLKGYTLSSFLFFFTFSLAILSFVLLVTRLSTEDSTRHVLLLEPSSQTAFVLKIALLIYSNPVLTVAVPFIILTVWFFGDFGARYPIGQPGPLYRFTSVYVTLGRLFYSVSQPLALIIAGFLFLGLLFLAIAVGSFAFHGNFSSNYAPISP